MSLVLDASLTLSCFLDDERTPSTDKVLERVGDDGAHVPSLWRLEVANALQVALRRRRLDAAYRDTIFAELGRFLIIVDAETDLHAWTSTLRLADRFRLTVYDAAYLELARRRRLPLATLDTALAKAAAALGVECLGSA